MHKLRTLHLFAGAGGGILADLLLGHQPVCAVEIDTYCQQVLHARQQDGILSWFPIFGDVTKFDGKPWRGRVDVVCGGFPCQDISAAGQGAGIDGERSGLWREMARIIGEVLPQYVFVENSPLLVGRGLVVVLSDLAKMGYDARWGIVGADDIGAPHCRKRIWILAYCRYLRWRGWSDSIESRFPATPNRGEVRHPLRAGLEGSEFIASDSERPLQSEEESAIDETTFSDGLSDTTGQGQSGPWESWFGSDPAETGEGEADHVFAERIARAWGIESRLGRVANGVASRMDRLKAIGNGQVAGVAALAWRTLSQ